MALRSAISLALFGGIGISVLFLLLWIDHARDTTLPATLGSFSVGRTMCDWSDAASGQGGTQPGAKRELVAWIWYPAVARQSSQTVADYLPAPWRAALARHSGLLLTNFLTRDLSRVRTQSVADADISPQEQPYPVVLLRAGLAAETASYTSIAEDLASHRYVVVGIDAPYRTIIVVLPDGRVIERAPENDADRFSGGEQEQVATRLMQAWSADMSFALDQLGNMNASAPPASSSDGST